MNKRTPLYNWHQAAGAKIVDFGGWDMPLHYGSQLEEHTVVRSGCGMFDVSHMTVVDVSGSGARPFLRVLLANDVDRIRAPGGALYSCMLNENGGVVDDLIAYWRGDDRFRLVVNAATRDKDLAWIEARATGFDLTLTERPELAMIAVQGPKAIAISSRVLAEYGLAEAGGIQRFFSAETDEIFVARTGYTGEDGFEIILPGDRVERLWVALVESGSAPIGLGARDTLRMEAGLNLYGQDMDESVNPLVSNLAWTIAWKPNDRDFIGRTALTESRDEDGMHEFVGLVLLDRGVLRHGQSVFDGDKEIGAITSGGFAPTLGKSIAMARVSPSTADELQVDVRGRRLRVARVKLPFVRAGQATFTV